MPEINTSPEQPHNTEMVTDYRVWNKTEFDEKLAASFEAATVAGTPLTLIKTDVNSLKILNDTLGHDEGDIVLDQVMKIAGVLAASLRTKNTDERPRTALDLVSEPVARQEDDIDAEAGRTGGDEIDIVIHADESQAEKIIQRIRNAVNVYFEKPENKQLRELRVGVAIGTATLKENMTLQELSLKADKAMHTDKLNQLPDLNFFRRVCFKIGSLCMKGSGVAPRYIHEYEEKYSLKKAA
jgi:GGDEF domain-containing protein